MRAERTPAWAVKEPACFFWRRLLILYIPAALAAVGALYAAARALPSL